MKQRSHACRVHQSHITSYDHNRTTIDALYTYICHQNKNIYFFFYKYSNCICDIYFFWRWMKMNIQLEVEANEGELKCVWWATKIFVMNFSNAYVCDSLKTEWVIWFLWTLCVPCHFNAYENNEKWLSRIAKIWIRHL